MIRGMLRLTWIALAVSAFYCDGKGPSFFLPGAMSPKVGNLEGLVLNGTIPIPQAPVTVSGSQAGATTSGTDGKYKFLDWAAGDVTVTATPSMFACPPVHVTIPLNATTTANIACTPLNGTITGTLHLGAGGLSGVVVTASQDNGPTVKTATTGADGSYTINDLPPGNYFVTVAPTANILCGAIGVAVTSGATTKADITCQENPPPGGLIVVVRLDGTPKGDVTVTVTQNGTVVRSGATGDDGKVTFFLPPGSVSVSVTPPSGTTCTPAQTVVIEGDKTTTATFDCTSSPGSVSGHVILDGAPAVSLTVTLTQSGRAPLTTTTDLFGNYSFTSVPVGSGTVTVTPSSGTSCSPTSQDVTVQSNQNTVANFECTTTPFTVTLSPSYRHVVVNVSSEACVKITTSLPQVGAAVSVTWTGPGNVGTNTRAWTTDANGEAFDRQAINVLGTYTATVTVTSNGVTVTASASVTVSSADGTCPAP